MFFLGLISHWDFPNRNLLLTCEIKHLEHWNGEKSKGLDTWQWQSSCSLLGRKWKKVFWMSEVHSYTRHPVEQEVMNAAHRKHWHWKHVGREHPSKANPASAIPEPAVQNVSSNIPLQHMASMNMAAVQNILSLSVIWPNTIYSYLLAELYPGPPHTRTA